MTCFGVKWFEKSNRLQLLVKLQCYVVDKNPPVLRILFDHPLLTGTNAHMNTHGV